MTQVVFNSSYYGSVANHNENYYTCRNANSGIYSDNTCGVGQNFGSSLYWTTRGFIYFDTSGIPIDAIITKATIKFIQDAPEPSIDFNIIIRGASVAHNPVVLGDYDLDNYNGENLGELTTSGNYLNYTLNDIGFDYINKNGITQFVLLSEEDINNDPPIGNEAIAYEDKGLTYIKLTVDYFLPTEPPVVSTVDNACKDRQSTTLTATGNIVSSGDGYTYRGFEYYEKGADLEYKSSMYAVREIGGFNTLGEFEMTLTGLKPSTIYYIRAFAGNIFGIDYGSWVLCSTTAVLNYKIYESTSSPIICFYLSEDDGRTWGLKHGPYTTDQVDIEITKLLVQGSGKKKIKFTTDTLTGISASVMCKLDIKTR